MRPLNTFVKPMLTDLYQLTMAYAYWRSGHHEVPAVFDLFFRKNPFAGEFTVFAGLEEALRLISEFAISAEDVRYLKKGYCRSDSELQQQFRQELEYGLIRESEHGYQRIDARGNWQTLDYPKQDQYVTPPMANCEAEFFDWLRSLDCSRVRIYALREGTIAFPRIPLIRVEGPLAIAQLLETTLLTLVNYPSLMATNAARFRLAAGKDKKLLEFGLRRAQGPDGGISASRYSYIGGFDATSNVLAGQLLGIPIKGTHAHSFVSTFSGLDDLRTQKITSADGQAHDFVAMVLKIRQEMQPTPPTNDGELAAFIAYAQAFPTSFLALVDTYDVLRSGVPNFLCVATALARIGYHPIGIRLDSGDLAYLSKQARAAFRAAEQRFDCALANLNIVASNDINEPTLVSLNQQHHEIDTFGIGTHLVTCQAQPALGAVYKLVEIGGKHRIKLSQEKAKVTIPGRKQAYRLLGKQGQALLDLMISADEQPPKAHEKVLCRHPFEATKRVYVRPAQVVPLHHCFWDGRLTLPFEPIADIRGYVLQQLATFREDHLRQLNPTPYKISISDELYQFLHELWLEETPIDEIE